MEGDEGEGTILHILPKETLVKVFLFVGPKSTANGMTVSRGWKQVCEDEWLWKQFCIQFRARGPSAFGVSLPPLPVSPQTTWKNHLKFLKENKYENSLPKRSTTEATTEMEIRYRFKICLAGPSGAGKSSMLQMYTSDSFNAETKPTIGIEFISKKLLCDGEGVILQIWDTAGQERYSQMVRIYFRGAQAIVIVLNLGESDASDSLLALEKWSTEAKEHGDADATIIVVGNKADLLDYKPDVFQEREKVLMDHCAAQGYTYFTTSAKRHRNLSELFEEVTRKCIERTQSQQRIACGVRSTACVAYPPPRTACGAPPPDGPCKLC